MSSAAFLSDLSCFLLAFFRIVLGDAVLTTDDDDDIVVASISAQWTRGDGDSSLDIMNDDDSMDVKRRCE